MATMINPMNCVAVSRKKPPGGTSSPAGHEHHDDPHDDRGHRDRDQGGADHGVGDHGRVGCPSGRQHRPGADCEQDQQRDARSDQLEVGVEPRRGLDRRLRK